MELSLSALLALARFTVANPRGGARFVLGLNLPLAARWTALALNAVLAAVFTHLSIALMPAAQREELAQVIGSPIQMAVLQGFVMVALVAAITLIGRMRGGRGSFADAIVLMAWLQFILLGLQMVQLALQLVVPLLADLVGLAGLGLFVWLLTNFTAELHGFRSLGLVFLGMLVSLLALTLGIVVLLMLFVSLGA